MKTIEEAMAFFTSRGFSTNRDEDVAPGGFKVGAMVDVGPANAGTQILVTNHLLYRRENRWVVQSYFRGAFDIDFDSLPDAVNALLARVEKWIAEHSIPIHPCFPRKEE